MIKRYEIIDNYVKLYINYKDEIKEAFIDLEDLEKVLSFPYAWHVTYDPKAHTFYVMSTVYTGGKPINHRIRLTKYLLNYDGDKKIDHINFNGLDDRKTNLRLILQDENLKNRRSKNSNNTTGIRNVCYHDGWYLAQLQIDGKNKVVGKFKTLDEAAIFIVEARQEFYGDFAGSN
jgi:hypothetical protein